MLHRFCFVVIVGWVGGVCGLGVREGEWVVGERLWVGGVIWCTCVCYMFVWVVRRLYV